MEYLFSKLLPLFVYPLGLALLLVLFAVVAVMRNQKSRAVVSLILAVGILWLSSINGVALYLINSLEKDYPPQAISLTPNADAVVILGGFTNATGTAVERMEINDAVDRLFHGMRLIRENKAPLVILVGGAAEGTAPEADFMAQLLTEFSIPREKMLLENKSRNTRENALNSVKIMQQHNIKKILLVTSAYHMRRAEAVFKKLGVEVIPAATDYQVQDLVPSILDWMPDARALGLSTLAIKEYLGWWVYRFKGWV